MHVLPLAVATLPDAGFLHAGRLRPPVFVHALGEADITNHRSIAPQEAHVRLADRDLAGSFRVRGQREIEPVERKAHDELSARFRLETAQRLIAQRGIRAPVARDDRLQQLLAEAH